MKKCDILRLTKRKIERKKQCLKKFYLNQQ